MGPAQPVDLVQLSLHGLPRIAVVVLADELVIVPEVRHGELPQPEIHQVEEVRVLPENEPRGVLLQVDVIRLVPGMERLDVIQADHVHHPVNRKLSGKQLLQ